jgi:hypothetical protein
MMMKIELLRSQAVPCTRYTAFAGMRFEVSAVSRTRKGGVWIAHMGRSVFVPEGDYKDVSPVKDFLERREFAFQREEA